MILKAPSPFMCAPHVLINCAYYVNERGRPGTEANILGPLGVTCLQYRPVAYMHCIYVGLHTARQIGNPREKAPRGSWQSLSWIRRELYYIDCSISLLKQQLYVRVPMQYPARQGTGTCEKDRFNILMPR